MKLSFKFLSNGNFDDEVSDKITIGDFLCMIFYDKKYPKYFPNGCRHYCIVIQNTNIKMLDFNKLLKDFEKDGCVYIYCSWNLTAYGPYFGNLMYEIDNYIDETIKYYGEKKYDISYLYHNSAKVFQTIFDKKYSEKIMVIKNEPVNDVDPITLEKPEITCLWLQNDKVYNMDKRSLLEHIEKNAYQDNFGEWQIMNPFYRENIPDPWRTEFLWLANRLKKN